MSSDERGDGDALLKAALQAGSKSDFRDAALLFRQAWDTWDTEGALVRLDTRMAGALLGGCLTSLGELEEAEEVFRDLVKTSSEDEELLATHFMLARCLAWQRGGWAEAQTLLDMLCLKTSAALTCKSERIESRSASTRVQDEWEAAEWLQMYQEYRSMQLWASGISWCLLSWNISTMRGPFTEIWFWTIVSFRALHKTRTYARVWRCWQNGCACVSSNAEASQSSAQPISPACRRQSVSGIIVRPDSGVFCKRSLTNLTLSPRATTLVNRGKVARSQRRSV